MRTPRLVAVLGVAALALTACGGGDPGSGGSEGGTAEESVANGDAVRLEAVDESPREEGPSALKLRLDDPSLPQPLVDPARVISGGPPPDGIPPVDDPLFLRPDEVGFLADDEPVVALEVDGQHRAYPVQIMVWHEIVNDTVGGVPVSVTYCPLCNSALAFERDLGERTVTFGTSGSLYLSDLVMYDRQTESLWSQLEGRAIAGVLTGEELTRIPVQTVTWAQWRTAHPDGWVLSRETGVQRDYGRNPYVGYDQPDSAPFLFDGESDDRLPPKERVIALGDPEDPVAVPLTDLSVDRVRALEVGGLPVVVWAVAGLRSALDTQDLSDGRALATSGAFRPTAGGLDLTFVPSGEAAFTDEETGTRWDVTGLGVDGQLEGEQLERVGHIDTFWFAWAAFHPDTRLVRAAP